MKRSICFVLISFCSLFALAQFPHPDTSYFFVFGNSNIEEFRDGCNHSLDSGYVMVGTSSSFSGDGSDIYLVKTDWKGKTLWSRIIGGNGIENGYAVKETPDHGFIIGGFTNSNLNQDYNMLLVKTDSQGFVEWQKTYGGSDWDFLYSVAICPDSGYVLCGETYSFGNLSSDIYLIRTDKYGDTIWTKSYGGIGKDVANKLILTSDSAIVAVGYTENNTAGLKDLYLLKCSLESGDSIFSTTKGGLFNDEARSVSEHTILDSGYVVVGYSESFTTNHDKNLWYVKFDKNGNYMWSDNFWNNGGDDEGTGIVTDGQNFFVCGYTANGSGFGDVTGAILDLNGYWQWNQATDYGSFQSDRSWANFKTLRNHFVFVGSTQSFNFIDQNAFIILIDTIKTQFQKIIVSSDSLVSISENSKNNWNYFPNPADGYFIFSKNKLLDRDSRLTIFDYSGKLIYSTILTNGQQDYYIGTENFPKGLYTFFVENDIENFRGKLIIENNN